MKKHTNEILKLLVLLTFTIMLLSACGSRKSQPPAQDTSSKVTKSSEATKTSDTAKIEITDMTGKKITLNKVPDKIVSLSPSNTEILFTLGAGNKVVGVTTYCDYPEEAKTREKIGTVTSPNIELIKKIQPDVVLAGQIKQDDFIKMMEDMGITVIQTEAKSVEGIFDSVKLIGKVTGTDSKAAQIIDDTRKKIADVQNKVKNLPKPNVFYLVWMETLSTAGGDTFISDVINIAGGTNIAAATKGWPKYSAEKLLQDNPDMVVAAKHSVNDGMSKEQLTSSPIFSSLSAAKKGNIFIMTDDNTISRPTPRIIEAIEEMAGILHPEFKK